MEERDAVAWLHRRAGFGLPPAELREAVARGSVAELDRLLDPAGVGGVPAVDPWDDDLLPLDPQDRTSKLYGIHTWLTTMIGSDRPLVDRAAWMWHGHFVSALDKVRVARLMVIQARLLRAAGLGGFRDLLRAITIDPAMLAYLDLRESTGSQPNENFSRELLELFTLGEGNYSEADVQAGALALSGWTLVRGEGSARFVARRHDDSPQRYLGVAGVHDLDTVIDAVLAHAALPGFIAAAVAGELLGTDDETVVDRLSTVFVASGFDVRSLVRATLAEGLAGHGAPLVLGPVRGSRRPVGSPAHGRHRSSRCSCCAPQGRCRCCRPTSPVGRVALRGSVPAAWWHANLAALIAAAAPAGEVLAAAQGDDSAVLADVLGLPIDDFADASLAALDAAPAGIDRLAVALITPEFMIA